MKCFVCGKKNAKYEFRPLISGIYYYVCNKYCYRIFTSKYKLCKVDVNINELKKRLYDYRKKKEEMKNNVRK